MYLVLALAAAGAFGAADFLGGLASRRAPVVGVVLLSQAVGLVFLAGIAPILDPMPAPAALGFGALAGLAYGGGILLLYRALAIGRMSVVAPITGVLAIALPVGFGLLTDEQPGPAAFAGIALAALSIGLISREAPAAGASPASTAAPPGLARRAVVIALGAGVGMGLFFISLGQTGAADGLWPLLAARVVSTGGFAVVGFVSAGSVRLPREVRVLALAGGVLDLLANLFYLWSVRQGLISLAATLTSLYPAATVLLAALVLRERIRGIQAVGLLCAFAAVWLITAR